MAQSQCLRRDLQTFSESSRPAIAVRCDGFGSKERFAEADLGIGGKSVKMVVL
jgi:hypothetical protein